MNRFYHAFNELFICEYSIDICHLQGTFYNKNVNLSLTLSNIIITIMHVSLESIILLVILWSQRAGKICFRILFAILKFQRIYNFVNAR